MPDWHPLGLGAAAALALMTLIWTASLQRRDVSVVDIFWGPGFALLAWIYRSVTSGYAVRSVVLTALVTLWGLRLGVHLLRRNWGEPEDYRYRAMREEAGSSFAYRSLVTVFWLQAAVLWLVALPLWAAQAAPQPDSWTGWDSTGVLLFAAGFLFETVGDWQLARFRADPDNRGKVLDSGLWRYTRHPNYFGDALLWWGFGLMALPSGRWWALVGPALMTLFLMRVSGVALLERRLRTSKPRYADYVRRTNAFFPWLPRSD